MRFQETYYHCGEYLRNSLATEIGEVHQAIETIPWRSEFTFEANGEVRGHQTAYNHALASEFKQLGWELQPVLRSRPRLIGDFRKHLVFVEVQFGNSATLYRDYYKFQYGHSNGLLSLGVLIVPTAPKGRFSSRHVRRA